MHAVALTQRVFATPLESSLSIFSRERCVERECVVRGLLLLLNESAIVLAMHSEELARDRTMRQDAR